MLILVLLSNVSDRIDMFFEILILISLSFGQLLNVPEPKSITFSDGNSMF